MGVILDLGYLLAAVIATPWVVYLLAQRHNREGFGGRLAWRLGAPLERSIWLHGSSAGEISLLRPLIARLEQDHPDLPLVISTFTSTGFQAARKTYPEHRVIFFPLDLSFLIRRYFRRLNPRLIVIVESEYWPNFILTARRQDIPVAILNGKMSQKSFRLYRWFWLSAYVLRRVSLLALQTEEHARRVCKLGAPRERVHVTGNMKYDLTAPALQQDIGAARRSLGIAENDTVLIGGSVHRGEDEALLQAFAVLRRSHSALRLVLVPRYPQEAAEVAGSVAQAGLSSVRKTELDQNPGLASADAVVIVDTVGDLKSMYGLSDIAYVGGSLHFRGANKGGHNLMEPAILGVPVIFGPYNFSFKDTVSDLLAADAGMQVATTAELTHSLERLISDAAARHAMGQRARRVVLDTQGATDRNYALLTPYLQAARRRSDAKSGSSWLAARRHAN
jgi:3-deoxy-D-manno-octulosonic-acid transferase